MGPIGALSAGSHGKAGSTSNNCGDVGGNYNLILRIIFTLTKINTEIENTFLTSPRAIMIPFEI